MMFRASISRVRLVGAVLFGVLAGCGTPDADRPAVGVEYRPSSELVRLQAIPLDGDDIGIVRDFDIVGDTIYLLDQTGRIVVVERGQAGLRLAGHIGRRGAGPGELMQPTGVASAGDNVMVADGTRLQFFGRSGTFLTSKWLTLPCTMMRPAVAPALDGLFVYGSCLRRGYVTDTMKAVLAWSRDTTEWTIVVETPRYTTDGSMGSVFGASNLLTTGVSGTHAFGGGEVNCVWMIDDGGGRPAAGEICPAAGALYSADPPPGLEQKMRSARFAGISLSWPASLPVYGDRIIIDGRTVLLRPFTADSVVLQLAAPASVDIAVAPHDGLIGCKAGGCLWLIEDEETPYMIVLDRSDLEMMISREAGK